MRSRAASTRLQAALFALLVTSVFILLGAYAVQLALWPDAPDRGWIASLDTGPNVVAEARAAGADAGLRRGDRILALNGQSYTTRRERTELLDLTLGGTNVYTIERGSEVLEVVVPTQPLGLQLVLKHNLPTLLLGAVFLAMGVLVFLMKPFHPSSWAFVGLAGLLGLLITYSRRPFDFEPVWLAETFRVAAFLFGATLIHLTAVFPQRRNWLASHWWAMALPYAVSAGLLAVAISEGPWEDPGTWTQPLTFVLPLIGLLVFLGSTIGIVLRSRSTTAQLQALVIFTGTLIALLVPVADITFGAVVGTPFLPDEMYSWLPSMALFPVSIGYAIVRHDLFEIDVIVRRTYGYLLSTGVVIALYGATVSTLNVTIGPSEIARSPLFTVAFVLGVIFLMQPLQGRIQGFVDRAFYRQRYDYRKTITEVTERMTSLLDPKLVRETLVGSVVNEMFLENGLLLAPEHPGEEVEDPRQELEVLLQAGDGWLGEPPTAIRLNETLWRALCEYKIPVFRHEIELAPQYEGQREAMLASFDALQAELALPMLYHGELRAVLSLGRKKSGKMFTREDVDLLRTLVAQSGVALENARLFDEVAESLKQIQMLETVKSNLAKFVPQTVQSMLEESDDAEQLFKKRDQDLSVMFADMTGYTRLSSQLPIDEVNDIIERYFGAFLDEILQHGGDVNETAGDGLMVLFQDDDPRKHAEAAARAALGIQRLTREINAEREGQDPIGMHIGINSGTASVGATKIQGGAGMRWTYTASGPITNIAARIGAIGERIAITGETRQRLGDGFAVEEVGPKSLKNVSEPVMVYRLTGLPEEEVQPSTVLPSPDPAEHVGRRGRFAITGMLLEAGSGRPLAGYVVRGFDRDLLADDFLGSAITDEAGRFQILFTDEAFGDLFESKPDIYLRVLDPSGERELYTTDDAVRWNAGAQEHFDVHVPPHSLSG